MKWLAPTLLFATTFCFVAPARGFADDMRVISPDQMKWAPLDAIPGTEIAVLSGDLGKQGPFVMEWRGPAGAKASPHWHTNPEGFLLLSDATCADDIAWRAGNVSRLIATILRGARRLGQDLLFESSVEALWTRVTRDLSGYLTTLWDLGALDGATPGEAFEVHCDRSTMTQADIDAGRLIVRVAVTVAQPVERITVTLTLAGDAGTISEAA